MARLAVALLIAVSVFASAVAADDAVIAFLKKQGLTVLPEVLAPANPAEVFAKYPTVDFTLLAPVDHAFSFNNVTLKTVSLALQNDTAFGVWVVNLLDYHVILGSKVNPMTLMANETFKTVLSEPLYWSASLPVPPSDALGNPYPTSGFASSLANITSWSSPVAGAVPRAVPGVPNLNVIVVDRILFPNNISSLFTGVVKNSTGPYGTNPPYMTVENNATADAFENAWQLSSLIQLNSSFSVILSLIDQFNLKPVLYNISATTGCTFFPPSDQAILNTAPTFALVDYLFDNDTRDHWVYNLLLQHVGYMAKSEEDLLKTSDGVDSVLGTVVRTANDQGIVFLYTWPQPVPLNVSTGSYTLLNSPAYLSFSIIGVDDVIFPYNATRLLPPSAIPGYAAPAPVPAPNGGGSTPAPPKGAASVAANAALLLVIAFCSLAAIAVGF